MLHLVGFYYKNISRCTVLWMSNKIIYISKCVFNISFIKPFLLLTSMIPTTRILSSTHQHIWLSFLSHLTMIARNKKLCKNSDKPISSHVYHPWQVSPWWTGSRQRVPWTTQQRSQQPTTQQISFMPNVKLSKCPPPSTQYCIFKRHIQHSEKLSENNITTSHSLSCHNSMQFTAKPGFPRSRTSH
jgi:hypothetical protein